MSDRSICSYEHVPDDVSQFRASAAGQEVLTEDGTWCCPHPKYGASDYCIFHATDIDDASAARRLLIKQVSASSTTDTNDRSHRFIGAKLSELDLSRLVLEAKHNRPLDFRHANIETLNFEHSDIYIPINLSGAEIGTLDGHNTTFGNRIMCRNANIGRATMESSQFNRRTTFDQTDFSRANFFNTVFHERVTFNRCSFSGLSLFNNTNFNHVADFSQTRWEGGNHFSDVVFQRQADFTELRLVDDLSITNSMFHSKIQMVPRLDAENVPIRVDFTDTTLRSGELFCYSNDDLLYDLTDATIGNIDLESDSPIDLHNLIFLNTTFDGFEFSRYTDSLLDINWYIHRTEPSSMLKNNVSGLNPLSNPSVQTSDDTDMVFKSDDGTEPQPGVLRSTYLRAKNGASEAGDDTASSEFFLREMEFKRKAHYKKFREHRSLKGLKDWLYNWFYNIVAGYGERPSRPFIVSVLIIIGFANVYLAQSEQTYSPAGLRTYFEFSFQAFVAFVVGSPPTTEFADLAAVQAFIGAFMIALFVFTLTRSIHR